MPLSDLPTEIILDIADHLGDAGTNALPRTNSRVCNFLNQYLHRRDVTKPQSKSSVKSSPRDIAPWDDLKLLSTVVLDDGSYEQKLVLGT